jgi:hypothetical protein
MLPLKNVDDAHALARAATMKPNTCAAFILVPDVIRPFRSLRVLSVMAIYQQLVSALECGAKSHSFSGGTTVIAGVVRDYRRKYAEPYSPHHQGRVVTVSQSSN